MKKNIAEIISVSNEIYDKGLVSGKSGNISARFGDVVAITPTLKSLSNLREEDIVLVNMEGEILTKGKPSSEVNMHLEIYKKRPDVKAIVHTHSPYATGFAFSDKTSEAEKVQTVYAWLATDAIYDTTKSEGKARCSAYDAIINKGIAEIECK